MNRGDRPDERDSQCRKVVSLSIVSRQGSGKTSDDCTQHGVVAEALQALELEVEQLPQDMRDRLATARLRAVHRDRNCYDSGSATTHGASQTPWQLVIARLSQAARDCPGVGPGSPIPSAILATGVAVTLVAWSLMSGNMAETRIRYESGVTATTSTSETGTRQALLAETSMQAEILIPETPTALTADDELDLYQSVEFLLWLESQAG